MPTVKLPTQLREAAGGAGAVSAALAFDNWSPIAMYWLVSGSAPWLGATMFSLAWKALSAARASSRSLRNPSSCGANHRAVCSASAAFIAHIWRATPMN